MQYKQREKIDCCCKENMKRKICFVGTAIQYAKKHYAIANAIKRKCKEDVEFCYVTYSKESANFFKKKGICHTYIIDAIHKIKLRGGLESNLKRIEGEYGVDVNVLLFGDYEHSLMNRKKALKLLVKYFLFWEDYLSKKNIDFILSGIERLKNIIPRVVSSKFKTEYYMFKASQIKNRFEVNSDPRGHISKLDKYWKSNKNKKLSTNDSKEKKKFIQEFKRVKKRTYIFAKPKIFGNVKFFIKRVLMNLFIEMFRNPYANLFHIAGFQVKKTLRKHLVNKLYSEPNYNDKIIFYPLHVEHDAQILVRAPQYANQLKLIKKISESIPKGFMLYVKEHPNNVGGTSIKKLKMIKSLSNVKLVSPYVNSHDLIKQSKMIVTINSTVGWEALIYEKPVVVLGTPFYEISGLIWKVNELSELKEKIDNALNKKIWKEEVLLKFVDAVFKSTWPGLAVFQGEYRKEAMSSENLELIGEGICKDLSI